MELPAHTVVADTNEFVKKFEGKTVSGYIDNLTYECNFEFFVIDTMSTQKCKLAGICFPNVGASFTKKLKVFIFRNLFNRDAKFKVVGIDKNGIAIVEETQFENSLAKQLLEAGMGDFDTVTGEYLSSDLTSYYKATIQEARGEKLGFWTASVVKPGASSRVYQAKVIEVHSADSVTVLNNTTREAVRVFFSNVRGPKMANFARDFGGEAYGYQAREYLRKKVIGQEVKVQLEYKKKIETKDREGNPIEMKLQCATIFLDGKNISELIIERGYAKFMTPREGESHTQYVVQLSQAEQKAEAAKLNQYSGKKAPDAPRLWDLSVPANKKKTSTDFRIRPSNEPLEGVLESIIAPTRLKVRVDSKSVILLLQINGLKTVKTDSNMPGNQGFADEALIWTKERYLQRPCKIVIENVDKYGNCHGTLIMGKNNLAEDLLENGYAFVKTIGRPSRNIDRYTNIERESRSAKVGMWGKRDTLLGIDGDLEAEKSADKTPFKGTLSEYISVNEFYVQRRDGCKLEQIQESIAEHHDKLTPLKEPVSVGTWCLAPFDGCLFRCKVTRTSKNGEFFDVFFVDFGNSDNFSIDKLKQMPLAVTKYDK